MGLPGAFITMIVKAIEREIVTGILKSDDEVSPAQILHDFNTSLKKLLKQEEADSLADEGFDAQVVYYNKAQNKVLFAGARNPLLIFKEGELTEIKSDRKSVGYGKSLDGFQFKDHLIESVDGAKIYISTDGFWDQLSGEKRLPLGKSKMKKLITGFQSESVASQKKKIIEYWQGHRGTEVQTDDITFLCLEC